MERELLSFLQEYKRLVVETDFVKEDMEKFEDLQEWLQNQILSVAENSERTFLSEESEAALGDVLSESVLNKILDDDDFVKKVKTIVLERIKSNESKET